MFILNVIPISRGTSTGELSYWSSAEVKEGAIVTVPIRKKTVPALVVGVKPAEDMKSEIRSADFNLKKITAVKAATLLSPHFIRACAKAAEYFASTPGAILGTLVPSAILESAGKMPEPKPSETPRSGHQKLVMQTDDEERFAHYKSIVREEFARKRSVFFCLPTIGDIHFAKEKLEKGIEKYTHVLHGSQKKSEIVKTWNAIVSEPHPVVVIATGSYLSLHRVDIKTYIIERENSRSYKIQTRPYTDIRTFAEFLTKELGAKLIFGDSVLRVETLWRNQADELVDLAPVKMRQVATASSLLVDMKENPDPEGKKKEFRVLSDELLELVAETKERDENTFLFAVRRGLSPQTVCGDCGATVLCSYCKAPTVLHTGKDNFFFCHRCGEKRNAKEYCADCGSWKLTTLGIGTERVQKELMEKFPDLKIFSIDKDTVKTHKKALETVEAFYNTPGSVLIGTEMALLYLNKKVGNTAVVSIDSLFAIPDFRINEKIFHILLKIRDLAQRKFLLQSRNASEKVLHYALSGSMMDFYREEVEERKKFGYPPFSALIKISRSGDRSKVAEDMKRIKSLFGEDAVTFPAFVPYEKGKYTMHALLKIARERWIDREVLQKFISLPPSFSIRVDPDTLL